MKFKVWCHSKNNWEDGECVIDQNGVLYHYDTYGRKRSVREDAHEIVYCINHKDIYGKELYTGDIVEFTPTTDLNPSRSVGEIREDVYDTGYYILNNDDEYPYVKLYFAMNIKLIGNKFENKDLLR